MKDMRRAIALLATAASLALGGAVALAAPASAAPGPRSVQNWCPGADSNAHPGLHLGWADQTNGERRNVGGTCPAG
jgi:hypothetical protein